MSASSEHEESRYLATLIDRQGAVVSIIRITAGDDDEACQKAKALVDGHGVDLWEDLRLVDHFPAIDPLK